MGDFYGFMPRGPKPHFHSHPMQHELSSIADGQIGQSTARVDFRRPAAFADTSRTRSIGSSSPSMSVVSGHSTRSYRSRHAGNAYRAAPGPFGQLRPDADRLLPHSRSFDKSYRDDRSQFNDNSTVISGCTSVCSYSALAAQQKQRQAWEQQRMAASKDNQRREWCCSSGFLCRINLAAIISALAVLAVPTIAVTPFLAPYFGFDWPKIVIDPNSQRFLLVLGVSLVLQIILAWKVHSGRPSTKLPRIILSRVAFALSLIFVLVGFGLLFVANDFLPRNPNYSDVLLHSLLLLVTTFLIHFLWYFFELRQPQVFVSIRVTRDPDGEAHVFSIRLASIQEAATEILSRYPGTFTPFNPREIQARREGSGAFKGDNCRNATISGFKVYNIDEEGVDQGGAINEVNAKALLQVALRGAKKERSAAFHSKLDYEAKTERKRFELVFATEQAFAHIEEINANNAKYREKTLDPTDTVKIILTVIYRPLSKYLKHVKRQHLLDLKEVEENLRICLKHRFTADTFLQPYFTGEATAVHSAPSPSSKWSLLCEQHPANEASHGSQFVLRCLDADGNLNIRLFCRVHANPVFNIVQERSRFSAYAYHPASHDGNDSPV